VARIYLEYLSGGTAANILNRCGPLREDVVADIAGGVLRGLCYLHDKDILHRDIKPANILITSQGLVKIADFGASKRIGSSRDAQGGVYVVVGTPAYMSPETIRGESLPECDIWSLGCTLHQLITNRNPWSSLGKFSSEQHYMAAILRSCQNESVLEESFAIPPEIELSLTGRDFLKKCLAPNAHIRPSCQHLLDHPWLQHSSKCGAGHAFVKEMAQEHANFTVHGLLGEMIESPPLTAQPDPDAHQIET
jgi:serine/threonine protein kinase